MVAAVVLLRQAALRVDGAAELAAPDDQRLAQQPAPLQVLDQPPAGLVDVAALAGQPAGHVGVVVPVVVIDLDEAHAALDHSPGQQRGVGERAGLLRLFAVERVGRGRLLAPDPPAPARSPACRRASSYCRVRVRVSGSPQRAKARLVQRLQAVERPAADLAGDPRRIVDEQDRVAGRAEGDARMFARKIARGPQPRGNRLQLLGVGGPGHQHDERRAGSGSAGPGRTTPRRPGTGGRESGCPSA